MNRKAAMLVFVLIGCEQQPATDSTTAGAEPPAAQSSSDLETAAREIVTFLQGNAALDPQLIADSVILYVSPEGGGNSTVMTRTEAQDRAFWAVASANVRRPFKPSEEFRKITTRVGRHFICQEYDLSSRFPQLAQWPHVGVKLEPESSTSCLTSWNMTFVFDSTPGRPRLLAAVYDQWEW